MLGFQWMRLCTAGEAFRPVAVSATVQNMIPITEQVAIQGNATFSSFNNTIYALGFNDTLYDTPYNYQGAGDFTLQFREGYVPESQIRIQLSYFKYWQRYPNTWFDAQKGIRWDPLQHPELLMQLRPSKNAITYDWSISDEDKNSNTWVNQYTIQSAQSITTHKVNPATGGNVRMTAEERVQQGSILTYEPGNPPVDGKFAYDINGNDLDYRELLLTPPCRTHEQRNAWYQMGNVTGIKQGCRRNC